MNNEKEGREQLKQGTASSTIQDVASSTIFDDVFRTMAQKMPCGHAGAYEEDNGLYDTGRERIKGKDG